MSGMQIGALGLVLMFGLLALRFPLGITMALVGGAGIWYLRGFRALTSVVVSAPYDKIASWTFTTIPMFLLMGYFAHHIGLTEGLYNAARKWLVRVPGGLAVTTMLTSVGFAAASGSSMAAVVTLGRIAVPEMLRYNYDKRLTAGVVSMGGTLAAIIPPSILIVLYGLITEQPIAPLLLAGFLPGILSAVFYTGLIIVRCARNPSLAPPVKENITRAERWQSLKYVWPLPVIVIVLIGGLYSGIFTATEAGAISAAVALLLGLIARKVTGAVFWKALADTARFCGLIMLIIAGVVLVQRFLALSKLPQTMSSMLIGWNLSPLALVIVISIFYVILGCFLDTLAIMFLTLPILLPVVSSMSINLIWFGIIVIKLMELGTVTPPYGFLVFLLKGTVGDQISLADIWKGVLPFVITDMVVIAILIAFPPIITILPNAAMH